MLQRADYLFWIYFYFGWYGIVLLGQRQDTLMSLLLPIPALLYLLWQKKLPAGIYLRAGFLAIVGILFDSFSNYVGWTSFLPGVLSPKVPVWLFSLWFLYLCYMPMLAKIFEKRLFLAFVAGALFGPLSYLSGAHFQLFRFSETSSIFIYSVFWGIHLFATARFIWK